MQVALFFYRVGLSLTFFVASFIVLPSGVWAQTTSCTSGGAGGSCVSGSNECIGGTIYAGTECSGNNEQILCCVVGGGGGNAGGQTACTASDNGSTGACYATNSCPNGLYYHTSTNCPSSLPACCTATGGSGSGSQCADTSTHCKSSCTNYGGIQSGCDNACPAGTGNYYYCVSATTPGGGGGGGGSTNTSTGWTGGLDAVKENSGLPQSSVEDVVGNFMIWLLYIFGFIAIIGFVVSGILYLTAAGDEGRVKLAKSAMTWSIVGVIVALMGYVIIQAVDVWLGGSTAF